MRIVFSAFAGLNMVRLQLMPSFKVPQLVLQLYLSCKLLWYLSQRCVLRLWAKSLLGW